MNFSQLNIKAFNDLAEHSIEWGNSNILWETRFRKNVHKEYWLSTSLNFIRRLTLISSFEERAEYLSPFHRSSPNFLADFAFSAPYDENTRPRIDPRVTQDLRDLAFAYDADLGPIEAYRWAYYDYYHPVGLANQNMRGFRRDGYVFFDWSRLQGWGVLDTPHQPQHQLLAAPPSSVRKQGTMSIKQRESFRQRSELFAKGGRGWWSESDQSRVYYLGD